MKASFSFPDDSVVVAWSAVSAAVTDVPPRLWVEVHVGPQAGVSLIATAEAEAQTL